MASSSPRSVTPGSSDETTSAETAFKPRASTNLRPSGSSSTSTVRRWTPTSPAAGASVASNARICTTPYWPTMASAVILTIGNELLSGDVENTNGSWLARRLEAAGVDVRLIAVLPDEIEEIAITLREHANRADLVVVTGGLGGTPDDLTRQAVAAAFGVEQIEYPDVAADLRARFRGDPEYAARWAQLPAGSRPLANPLGGAPGFLLENVYVLPGLPAEMEAMYETIEDELRAGPPIGSWRRSYRTTESRIVAVLAQALEIHPQIRVGSYPSFGANGPYVEVVLKSGDPYALEAAAAWLTQALEQRLDQVT